MRIPAGAASLVLAAVLAGGTGRPCTAGPADEAVTVQRSGAAPSRAGPPETFTGAVRVDPLLRETPPRPGSPAGSSPSSPGPARPGTPTRSARP
ncbi:hypothetical protein OPKNFCMD_5742 [Methylobacterium crusticola]|uniref:Uncharacterized protein n=1 Tax=Methylobacterium crusticola TaxID=1697972 RepID=A0ABQ4R727_9HYPH|nr:hypothetical protein OPKNFCMD_5742 [Methylobacterium crusticola]